MSNFKTTLVNEDKVLRTFQYSDGSVHPCSSPQPGYRENLLLKNLQAYFAMNSQVHLP